MIGLEGEIKYSFLHLKMSFFDVVHSFIFHRWVFQDLDLTHSLDDFTGDASRSSVPRWAAETLTCSQCWALLIIAYDPRVASTCHRSWNTHTHTHTRPEGETLIYITVWSSTSVQWVWRFSAVYNLHWWWFNWLFRQAALFLLFFLFGLSTYILY